MVFQLDARIPLGFSAGYDPAVAQRNQLMRLQREAMEGQVNEQNALRDVLQRAGGGLNADDPNKRAAAAAEIAQVGPAGYQIAAPIMSGIRNQREIAGIMGGGVQPAAMPAGGGVRAEPLPPAAPTQGGAPNPQWNDRSLPRGLRNNNPLNLSFVAGQPGVQGSDGRFGRYNSMEDGVAAATRQLQMYGQRGLTTIEGIISRWAPPNENNTQAYINAVARATGLDPRAPVDLQNPEIVSRLVAAMGQHENGRALPMDAVQRGVQMALGGGMATPASTPATGGAPASNAPAGAPMPAATPRMPGQPSPQQFGALMQAAANGNEQAQRLVQMWAPFMRQETRPPQAPPAPVRLGDGPAGPAGMFVPDPAAPGGYRRVADAPPATPQVVIQGEGVRARADAATLTEMQQSATQARSIISLLDRAEQAVRRTPEGQGAQLLPVVGQTARALGFNVDGTAEAEVLRSITLNLATLQRVPGSGATTDMEMRLYMQAVPRLGGTREGNLALIDMGRRLAQRRIAEADIYRRHAGEPDLMERLNALPPVFTPEEINTLQQDATPASGPARPAGIQADPPAAPAIPSLPRGVPQGSAFSPSRNMWRTPDGRLFNADGTPAR